MKFEELKISLKNKIECGYILFGVDEYLLSSSYNLILKYSGIEIPELNVIKFTDGVINCEDVVRALETMPVFSDKKLVYVDLRMARKSEVKNISEIDKYMSSPNEYAILVVNIGDNDEFQINKTAFELVDCNRLDFKIVSAKIKSIFKNANKTIDDVVIKKLSDYCLGDLSKIIIECEKLISYVGDRNEVNIVDIDSIVNKSIEYQVFELTENLSKKNAERVFEILEDMKSKKEEYKTLPAIIYSHFRRLFMISLNSNMTNLELSKLLGIKEYAVKMSRAQVGLFSKSNLKKINELCIKLDFDLKQSNVTIDNAISMIVLQILNI